MHRGTLGIGHQLQTVENFGEYSNLYLSRIANAPMIAKVPEELVGENALAISFQIHSELCHLFEIDGDALAHLILAPGTFACKAKFHRHHPQSRSSTFEHL